MLINLLVASPESNKVSFWVDHSIQYRGPITLLEPLKKFKSSRHGFYWLNTDGWWDLIGLVGCWWCVDGWVDGWVLLENMSEK